MLISRLNSTVRILDDCVEKFSASPSSLAKKYEAIHRISLNNGFLAPKVLEVREESVVIERIQDIVSMGHLYTVGEHDEFCQIAFDAGVVLGCIHRELPTAGAAQWTPSPDFERLIWQYRKKTTDIASLPQASLHCDYSFANVFIRRCPPPNIVIIDPCPNFGSTFYDWTLGPILIDIGKMLTCLEGQIPPRRQMQLPSRPRIEDMQQRFLKGYEDASGLTVDSDIAHAFAYAVANQQFRRRYGAFGKMYLTFLYNRIRGNYPLNVKINRSSPP